MSSKRCGFPGAVRPLQLSVKPPESGGFQILRNTSPALMVMTSGSAPLQPLLAPAAAVAIAIAVTAGHAMTEAVAPSAAAKAAGPVGQDRQAPLLAFIERLVERIGRVGDLLHRRSRARHEI